MGQFCRTNTHPRLGGVVLRRIVWYYFGSIWTMRSLFHRSEAPQPVIVPAHSDVPEVRGAELASVYHSQRIAGDFYDFFRVSSNRVMFGLLDAAGGLAQTRAILTATQHTFRSVGADLFSRQEANETEAMIELCHGLNHTVISAAAGVHSCPAFAGCYDETLGLVCYFNAGHISGLARDGNGVVELHATGLPLGLFSHATSDASIVALEPGAVLALVSRGVIEAKYKSEEFGLQRVKDVLQQSPVGASATELCASILDYVQQFMHATPTHDDVTALVLARHS